jgi:ABC transporter with metal-binding/Fe-S-binding domain ATP-binding protein
MRLAVLFSGGKDSVYAAYLAKKAGHELVCLVSIISENKESYMFHTPSIEMTKKQAKVMKLPLVIQKTKGEKEKELEDLELVLKKVQKDYEIEGVVTGAIQSVYQASRIQKICDKLGLECVNPLWQRSEENYLEELLEAGFKIMITGVFAYPLDKTWIARIIDKRFIEEVKALNKKHKIHIAGEGGEFESFVLNCPLFKRELKVKKKIILGEAHSWRAEIGVE